MSSWLRRLAILLERGRGGTRGLKKARSLLLILLATCRETSLALEAVGNVLDTDLGEILDAMIVRSERELEQMSA